MVQHCLQCYNSESTKQMEQTLRAKVKIFFKSENLKKMLLIKNDGLIGFTVVCKIVHKFASVWCKTALGEVGVSLP